MVVNAFLQKKNIVFVIVCAALSFFLLLAHDPSRVELFYNTWSNMEIYIIPGKPLRMNCSDCLQEMVRGKWIPKKSPFEEQYRVERFLSKSRGKYFIPTTLTRPDGRCGNTTFDFLKRLQHQALWFRPLCDPEGPTPCCHDNVCVDKPIGECNCDKCFDMRTQINAELSTWLPDNPNCKVHQYDIETACDLLQGANIVFVGDSFLRQVYTATAGLLSGNFENTTLKTNIPKGWYRYCSGWMQFLCYKYLNFTSSVCGGKTKVQYVELLTHNDGKRLLDLSKRYLNHSKTLLFVGIGIHGTYQEKLVWTNFLKPTVTLLQEKKTLNIPWPEFVWLSPHAPGILKTPRVPGQSYASVKRYNAFINAQLILNKVPLMDTFNMTEGVMSYDGAHYGYGINMLKSQILFNYINQLASSGRWR